MRLDSEHGGSKNNPQPADVEEALRNRGDGFVILAHTPEEYLQVAGNQLEHRMQDRQYAADAGALDETTLRVIFLDYLGRRPQWRERVTWRERTEEAIAPPRRQAWWGGLVMLAIFAAGAAYLLWPSAG